jgi:hypothetical protein
MSDPRDPRDRLPPPPIEPLPDLSWARLERAVLAELDVPETRAIKVPLSRWPLFALGGAALAGAAALVVVLATGDATTPVRSAEPEAYATVTSRVVTRDAATEVSFGDAHITVAPASAVVLDGTADQGVLAVLERGSAAFVVAPRRARPAFVIQAGAVGVRVVGTEFSVARLGTDDAEVTVTEGAVEVTFHGRVARVTAGETWSSVPPVTASTSRTARVKEPAAPAPRKPAENKPEPTPQERFEAAAKLEATDPDAANDAYREVARGKGQWASNALYAMARLAYDRGKRDSAKAYLNIYKHRFPRGGNIADVKAMLVELEGGTSR